MQFTYTPKAPEQDKEMPQLLHVLSGKDLNWKARITANTGLALARLELTHHHADGHSNLGLNFTKEEIIKIAKGLIDAAAALDPTAIEQDGPSA